MRARATPTAAATRRRYNNTLRRQRAAETRDRIVIAGGELLRGFAIRDWRALTVRAVAERAGVNERTVFRHFANEKDLRDAVMHHLERQAGIDLTRLRLDGVADATARILHHVATYPPAPRLKLEPTLAEASRRQHDALIRAVEEHTAGWPPDDRVLAAAMFDVLWAVSSFERLVADWHLGPDEAIRAITWVVALLQEAVTADCRPSRSRPSRATNHKTYGPGRG